MIIFFFRNLDFGIGLVLMNFILVVIFKLMFICCFLLYCIVGFKVVLLFFIVVLMILIIGELIRGFMLIDGFIVSVKNELS